jgi:NTP pyrophosphatase (non-canonical NTP hydrolase)
MPKNSDEKMTVGELKKAVLKFSKERDWLKYHNPKDLAISLSIETAELLERFQWINDKEIDQLLNNPKEFNEVKYELADVFNYAIALSNKLGIDISKTLLEKIKNNEKKYPTSKIKGHYQKHNKIT